MLDALYMSSSSVVCMTDGRQPGSTAGYLLGTAGECWPLSD